MWSVLFTLAIVAAATAMALRHWRERRARRQRGAGTVERAMVVARFDDIDHALDGYRCRRCGDTAARVGEFSRTVGERRFRVCRVVCRGCGREERVHFDVTAAFS